MYVCVDFDGTIVDNKYPEIGEPVPGAIKWLIEFSKHGAKLILFTMRSGKHLDEAVQFLTDHGVALCGINENPSQSWSDSPKVYADLYIDDRAFGCPLKYPEGFHGLCVNWDIVGPMVTITLAGKAEDYLASLGANK